MAAPLLTVENLSISFPGDGGRRVTVGWNDGQTYTIGQEGT